jgi:RNA polymerase sigma-70 factor (ECF subfamily)
MNTGNFYDGPIDLSTLDIKEYESLFHQHYQWLCLLAYKIVPDWPASEDIVQDFFARCWQNRSTIIIRESWKGFAARSVKNSALNYLKKEDTRIKHETASFSNSVADHELPVTASPEEADQRYLDVLQAINKLPEQRRKVFILSRQPDMKNADIAEALGISVNTVKMHIRLAYQELRNILKAIPFFFYFF